MIYQLSPTLYPFYSQIWPYFMYPTSRLSQLTECLWWCLNNGSSTDTYDISTSNELHKDLSMQLISVSAYETH